MQERCISAESREKSKDTGGVCIQKWLDKARTLLQVKGALSMLLRVASIWYINKTGHPDPLVMYSHLEHYSWLINSLNRIFGEYPNLGEEPPVFQACHTALSTCRALLSRVGKDKRDSGCG